MSRKFHLERLESRDTPSTIGSSDPLNFNSILPPSVPLQVAPINLTGTATGTTVVIGLAIADPTMGTSLGLPNLAPIYLSTPSANPSSPFQFYTYDPGYYAWLMTPL